jgi:hypothetical protein
MKVFEELPPPQARALPARREDVCPQTSLWPPFPRREPVLKPSPVQHLQPPIRLRRRLSMTRRRRPHSQRTPPTSRVAGKTTDRPRRSRTCAAAACRAAAVNAWSCLTTRPSRSAPSSACSCSTSGKKASCPPATSRPWFVDSLPQLLLNAEIGTIRRKLEIMGRFFLQRLTAFRYSLTPFSRLRRNSLVVFSGRLSKEGDRPHCKLLRSTAACAYTSGTSPFFAKSQ